MRAMKIICGTYKSYATALEEEEIPRLDERRLKMFENFTVKASNNSRISNNWFPMNPPASYNIRNPQKYIEMHARTERLKNSPLYTMRRLLNNLN